MKTIVLTDEEYLTILDALGESDMEAVRSLLLHALKRKKQCGECGRTIFVDEYVYRGEGKELCAYCVWKREKPEQFEQYKLQEKP